MPTIKKLRNIGGTLVITIPKQVCDMYDLKANDKMEISPIGYGEFKIKKVDKDE